jgi:hypothetical protein
MKHALLAALAPGFELSVTCVELTKVIVKSAELEIAPVPRELLNAWHVAHPAACIPVTAAVNGASVQVTVGPLVAQEHVLSIFVFAGV